MGRLKNRGIEGGSMGLLPEVDELVRGRLVPGLKRTLNDNLVGIYLRGSLAMGDFIPETSDVDILVIVSERIDNSEFAELGALHEEMAALPNRYAGHMEVAYIDRASVRRYQPGMCHPTLYRGERLAWSEHRENWILERWTVREHGVVLIGPDPKTLIDPISEEDLRQAVRTRLRDWGDWANQPDDPDWQLPRSHKAYVVETMCRALYTMAHGTIGSKAQSVDWAIKTFPEPWRSTVRRSRAWRTDDTPDPFLVPEIRDFVHWAVSQSRWPRPN